MRRHVTLLAALLLVLLVGSSRAQSTLGFEPVQQDWFEVTVGGGWNVYEAGANRGNSYGSTPVTFDDGRDAGSALMVEIGLRLSRRLTLGLGFTRMRAYDKAETTEYANVPPSIELTDAFTWTREVHQTINCPHVRLKAEVLRAAPYSISLNGGVAVAATSLNYEWSISGLSHGDGTRSVDPSAIAFGLIGSVGLTREIATGLSIGGELGYREFQLSEFDWIEVSPDSEQSLLSFGGLEADYGGVYGLVTLSFRP